MATQASSGQVIGHVTALTGTVTVSRGGTEQALNIGDPIYLNDVVRTADLSTIVVQFVEGNGKFNLDGNSVAVIDGEVFDHFPR